MSACGARGGAETGLMCAGAAGVPHWQRLKQLERLGVVESAPKPDGRGHRYKLTRGPRAVDVGGDRLGHGDFLNSAHVSYFPVGFGLSG